MNDAASAGGSSSEEDTVAVRARKVVAERAEPPRARVSRYVALEQVGQGNMGRVLRAYDPKLRREVALKEVYGGALDEGAAGRMILEARAMAKLSHPNVVAVYDVEELENAEVVLVMEFVAGPTLADWLRAESRPTERIVDAFIQAGRGLAAAHARGLLHRDFKPANVLVSAAGTVKVTDFGLAKTTGTSVHAPSIEKQASADEITAAGSVVGTPRYMPPEQHFGEPLSPKADQYAFCVSLWIGLCGDPPFSGTTMAQDKLQGPPDWPGRGTPRRVIEAIMRGLAPDPEQRWPSMDALLDALGPDAVRDRSRSVAAVGGLVLLGIIGVGYGAWADARAQRCSGAREHLAGVWDDERRDAVRSTFSGLDKSYAGQVLDNTVAALDAYADDWTATHTEVCEATAVREEQSPAMMDLRMACLHRAALELGAAVDVLVSADAEVMGNAHRVTEGLRPPSRCSDARWLRSTIEPPQETERPGVEAVRLRLAEVRALLDAGAYRQAVSKAAEAARAVEPLTYGPIRTESTLLEARALAKNGEYRTAEARLREAITAAGRWKQDEQLAEAVGELLFVLGSDMQQYDRALMLEQVARGLADRDPRARARLLHQLGSVYFVAGRLDEAEAVEREALALRIEQYGPQDARVAATRNNLGNTLLEAGRYDEARAMYREALDIAEAKLGPTHPDVARTLYNLAIVDQDEGKLAEAETMLRRAIELSEAGLGPAHPAVGRGLASLGVLMVDQGRFDEADSVLRRALQIRREALGEHHPSVGASYSNLASSLAKQGRYEGAIEFFERALDIQERVLGKGHHEVETARINLGVVITYGGRPEDAEPVLREGIAGMEATLGSDHPQVALAQLNLANVQMMTGQLGQAEFEVRSALKVMESKLSDGDLDLVIAKLTLGVILSEQTRFAEAEGVLLQALEMAETTLDDDHMLVVGIRQNLGVCALGQGRAKEALELAERVWAVRGQGNVGAEYQGETAFLLAKATLAAGGPSALPRARSMAARALVAFEQASEGFSDDADEVRAWLEDPVAATP